MPNIMRKNGKASITLFAIILLVILGVLALWFFLKKTDSRTLQGEPIAYHYQGTAVTGLQPVGEKAKPLPDELIIKPGFYEIYGETYDLSKEGLYRFLLPIEDNQQRIVFENDAGALMSAVAWIYSHGNLDNGKTIKALEKKAKTEKLVGTCGKISGFIQKVLQERKIASRLVWGLTAEKLNGYDDSHVMIELNDGSGWKLYDLDNNAIFKQGGRQLSYYDFRKALESGGYEIEQIASDTSLAIDGFSEKNGYDYSFYMETVYRSEASLREWYRTKLYSIFMKEGGQSFYFLGEEQQVKKFDPKTIKISEEEFLKRFYHD